jgi:hypothetical protein
MKKSTVCYISKKTILLFLLNQKNTHNIWCAHPEYALSVWSCSFSNPLKTTAVKEILPVSTGISPNVFACFTRCFTPTHQLLLHHPMKTKADKRQNTKNENPKQQQLFKPLKKKLAFVSGSFTTKTNNPTTVL